MPNPTPSVVASDIMDISASLLNDTAKSIYTYAIQLPYLKKAMVELREHLEYNNVPVTNTVSAIITIPAAITTGTTTINFASTPALPGDLVEIQQAWERLTGTDPFVPLTRVEFLPHYLEGALMNQFVYWSWQGNGFTVLNANQTNDVKLDYIAELINSDTITQTSVIGVINSRSFLEYRTASLIAKFVSFNDDTADALNSEAVNALDRSLGIESKARQAIYTRHRPFRAGWKSRGLF